VGFDMIDRRCSPIFFVLSVAVGVGRSAGACPPSVRLSGDKVLIGQVTAALVARGIALEVPGCSSIAIELERRGAATVVSRSTPEAGAAEQTVTNPRTAATVIESWVRTDVDEPLLERGRVDDEEPTDATSVAVAGSERAPGLGLEVFAAAQTGVASDRTASVGAQFGACVRLGLFCVGGRGRVSTVTEGPAGWEQVMERELVDALASVDLPVRVGRFGVTPGLGVGAGWFHTHEEGAETGKSTVGLREDAHVALSLPLSQRIAVEVSVSLGLAQGVRGESTSNVPLPSEPHLLADLGAGFRFEGP
jgi:hypothetical protein